MTRLRPFALLLAASVPLLAACSPTSTSPAGFEVAGQVASELPAEVRRALEQAPTVELLSLDPYPRDYGEQEWIDRGLVGLEVFHDRAVLGTLTLDDETRRRAVQALYDGIADSDGKVAACFDPRHGFRATHEGHTVEVVICYECLSMQAFIDGAHAANALTTEVPKLRLDALFREGGVRLPDR